MAVKMDGSRGLNSTLISYIINKRVNCLYPYLDPRLQLRRAASKPGACVLSWLLGLQDRHTHSQIHNAKSPKPCLILGGCSLSTSG